MSYMDRKNILTEGFVDFILKAIFKKYAKGLDKKLKNDPELKRLTKDYEDSVKDYMKKFG
tara:strand:+ start:206 stop:385 length:180 start_codon:yes stop_codon:yes gene_type:complete